MVIGECPGSEIGSICLYMGMKEKKSVSHKNGC